MVSAFPGPDHAVYRDRAHLIALLAAHYPALLTTDPHTARQDTTTVVVVYTANGALSWPIANADLDLFTHVPEGDPGGWDHQDAETRHHRMRAETTEQDNERRNNIRATRGAL
ncbi:MAG: hypothetical protein M3548_09750 [Actinomycetota bacterium]|nr:hypothetical protein [Actinomycetota bacterium]